MEVRSGKITEVIDSGNEFNVLYQTHTGLAGALRIDRSETMLGSFIAAAKGLDIKDFRDDFDRTFSAKIGRNVVLDRQDKAPLQLTA